jgi:hypothetical protein
MSPTRTTACLLGLLLAVAAAAEETRDLDGMAVIGNQELPKALYIVPWKDAELGEHQARLGHGLSDNPLEPLDRNVFRRELHYHRTLQSSE